MITTNIIENIKETTYNMITTNIIENIKETT